MSVDDHAHTRPHILPNSRSATVLGPDVLARPARSRRERTLPVDVHPDADAFPVSDVAEAPTGPEGDDQGAYDVGAAIVRADPATTVVSLTGRIDLATAHVLAAALASAVSVSDAGERIVLELNRVTFLGACELGVILAAHGDAARRGITVVLVIDEVGPAALSLRFLPTGHSPAVFPTVTAALDSCAGSGTAVEHGGRPDRPTSRSGGRTGREQR